MIAVKTNVAYTQAGGCWFCLHIGSVALYVGRKPAGKDGGHRLEICTPSRWLRWSRARPERRALNVLGDG